MFSWLRRRSRRAPVYPPAPVGLVIYAIGDIHGCDDLLAAVHNSIDVDRARSVEPYAVEIYLGDYVDRGPASRQVIDRLIARSRFRNTIFLRGNHEDLFEHYMDGRVELESWWPLGAEATLASYGIDATGLTGLRDADTARHALSMRVPLAHRRFLATLLPAYPLGRYVFVHAGLRPRIPLERQRLHDLIWIRQEFLRHSGSFGAVVVHGHTPVSEPQFRRARINIDTGAFASGRLTCLRIGADGPRLTGGGGPVGSAAAGAMDQGVEDPSRHCAVQETEGRPVPEGRRWSAATRSA